MGTRHRDDPFSFSCNFYLPRVLPINLCLALRIPPFPNVASVVGWTETLPRQSLKGVYALVVDSVQPLPLAVGAVRTGEALECLFCVLGRD